MDKNIKMDIIFQGILILLWAFIGIFYIFADVEIWLKCLWIILSIFWIITGVNKINKLHKSKKWFNMYKEKILWLRLKK